LIANQAPRIAECGQSQETPSMAASWAA
jgi:hypothetical protein